MSYKRLSDADLLESRKYYERLASSAEWGAGAEASLPLSLIEQVRRANAIEAAAEALRQAERAYQATPGDQGLGKQVAEAAGRLDDALAAYRGSDPKRQPEAQ